MITYGKRVLYGSGRATGAGRTLIGASGHISRRCRCASSARRNGTFTKHSPLHAVVSTIAVVGTCVATGLEDIRAGIVIFKSNTIIFCLAARVTCTMQQRMDSVRMELQDVRRICEILLRACNQRGNSATLDAVVDVVSVHIEPSAARAYSEPSITLWASELASYMGLESSFQNRLKALGGVWRRTNEAQYRAVLTHWRANGCMIQGSTASRFLHDPFPAVTTVEQVRNFCKTHTTSDISKLYKAKGRLFEDELVARFAASIQQDVDCRHAAVTWRSDNDHDSAMRVPSACRAPGLLIDPGAFTIVGEVDGCITQGPYAGAIVEIKLRLQELRQDIPTRDYMQIQAYMHLFRTNIAFYVQGLFGTEQLLVKPVERNVAEWNDVIMPALRMFVCDVRRLLRGAPEDAALRSAVLQECNSDPLPAREFVPDVPLFKPMLSNLWLPPVLEPVAAAASSSEEDEKALHDTGAVECKDDADDEAYFVPLFAKSAAVRPPAAKQLPRAMTRSLLAAMYTDDDDEEACPTYNLRSKSRKRPRTRSTKI